MIRYSPVDMKQEKFDFDSWRELFETSPDLFEQKRREAIDEVIGQASTEQQSRLRGLQWRIDVVRQRHKHPIASTAKLFQLMWDKVYGENGLQDALTKTRVWEGVSGPTAKVLHLKLIKK